MPSHVSLPPAALRGGGASYHLRGMPVPAEQWRFALAPAPSEPSEPRTPFRLPLAPPGLHAARLPRRTGARLRARPTSATGSFFDTASSEEGPGDMALLPVTEEGAGAEQLFFVHGWPDDEHLWDAQVAHFRSRFRCLRITMPHFAGRGARALGHRPEGYSFIEAADLVAKTIRMVNGGKPVTLVIHDWGCIWGFLLQIKHPALVKAIVAMDVGSPAGFLSGWRNLPNVVGAGLAYQYWLLAAYLLRRSTANSALEGLGRPAADWMARSLARLVGAPIGEKEERITADACYPYFYFQTGWGVPRVPDGAAKGLEAGRDPSCPCLFFYGARKPFMFHRPAWERHLRSRKDCKVVPLSARHWLQVELPQEVNTVMQDWLDETLPTLQDSVVVNSSRL